MASDCYSKEASTSSEEKKIMKKLTIGVGLVLTLDERGSCGRSWF